VLWNEWLHILASTEEEVCDEEDNSNNHHISSSVGRMCNPDHRPDVVGLMTLLNRYSDWRCE
jgi:hypothetical protein